MIGAGLAASLAGSLMGARGGLIAIAAIGAAIAAAALLLILIGIAISLASERSHLRDQLSEAQAGAQSCGIDLGICQANIAGQGAAIDHQNAAVSSIAADCIERNERASRQAGELLAAPDRKYPDTVAGMNQWLRGYAP